MICRKCEIDKPQTKEFFEFRTDTNKYRSTCRTCDNVVKNQYKSQNRSKIAITSRLYDIENADKILIRKRKYYQQNKQKILARRRKWHNERYATDVNYKMTICLRVRVRQALKKTKKSASTMRLVGCSLDDLKIHLESQFTDGMTWENYGDWHVDHIRPCASFDLKKPEEQRICFHYTNLQPLWAADNESKGARQ